MKSSFQRNNLKEYTYFWSFLFSNGLAKDCSQPTGVGRFSDVFVLFGLTHPPRVVSPIPEAQAKRTPRRRANAAT